MNPTGKEMPPLTDSSLQQLVTRLNSTLARYSDKDWNYSRISLSVRPLENIHSPYVLYPEVLDLVTRPGRADLKALTSEIKWGEHHAAELGILEVISLRINNALLQTSSDESWQYKRPVIRTSQKHLLVEQGICAAFWYEVQEVAGEDFDNR